MFCTGTTLNSIGQSPVVLLRNIWLVVIFVTLRGHLQVMRLKKCLDFVHLTSKISNTVQFESFVLLIGLTLVVNFVKCVHCRLVANSNSCQFWSSITTTYSNYYYAKKTSWRANGVGYRPTSIRDNPIVPSQENRKLLIGHCSGRPVDGDWVRF